MKKISSEDVRTEVRRFWAILSGNLADKLEEMYSPTAIAFTGKAKRSESAKLMAVRRSRQLPGPAHSSKAEVGSIDVRVLGPDVAIAAYTYSFNTQKFLADGSKVQVNTPFGEQRRFSSATRMARFESFMSISVLRRLPLRRKRANDRTASAGKQSLARRRASKDSDGSKAHSVLCPTMSNISSDDVRAEVQKFWDFLSRKLKSQFAEMYLSSATVFAADARRMEPARLMLVRRDRELLGPASFVAAKIGSIDVQPLGADLAIASYPFHLSITRTRASGKRYQSEVPSGRATQVFQRDEKGVLRIIHEHMSSAEPVSTTELPPTDPPEQV